MNPAPLLQEIDRRPLCCDGAMGTQLISLGLGSGECGMLLNVNRPAEIGRIHLAYRQAGCDLITTNTFGGSRFGLARHGLADRGAELNRAAAQIARAAAGPTGWVLGDVGPFGDFLEPLGDTTADDLRAAFRDQIAALLEGGADAILIETMSDPAEAVIALEAAKACDPKIPVIATFAFQKTARGEFRTMMGVTAAEAAQRALAAGAEMVGANCGTALSLDDYVDLGKQLAGAAGKAPVVIRPNAGSPRTENGRTTYDARPEDMAAAATRLLAAGARMIGGCCGTAPNHLAAISRAVHTNNG